jgi:hypothetical protein
MLLRVVAAFRQRSLLRPGALVRLPSAFTDNHHSMTATVTEDAKQRFLES